MREVLFSGWGTGDTHAGPSNLQYGLDNWIYGMLGYTGFAATRRRRDGTRSARASIASSRTARSWSSCARPNNNTWGVGFSEEGIVFGSTANGYPSVYMPIPNRYYESGARLVAVAGAAASIADTQPLPADHRQGAAGRLARRLHRGGRPRPLHRPHLPAGILEPHRLRQRADRPPRRRRSSCERDGSDFRSTQRAGTCWPATTSGRRRSWPRSAPTATSG